MERSLAGYGAQGCTELDMNEVTQHTHTNTHTHTKLETRVIDQYELNRDTIMRLKDTGQLIQLEKMEELLENGQTLLFGMWLKYLEDLKIFYKSHGQIEKYRLSC